MTFVALARKWRPKTFATLIGQDHVNNALTYALRTNRLHHAYLFTGTRGIGKTSVARLLAKAMSCEQGIQAEPCLQCDTCVAIEQGHYIDLIEIDGASKTRIEDTRELLDNVPYAPTIGRFKIYLIDEVHMLSQHSFNALLKTLEEPPAHVKFLLATTDAHKLPLTILSRCLQFHLKALQPELIATHLTNVLNQEQLEYETEALPLIARAAEGSLRDALSLLDQAIAAGGGQVRAHDVRASLGMSQTDYAKQILHALANGDVQGLLQASQLIYTTGGYFQYALETIQADLHQINVAQALGYTPNTLQFDPDILAFSLRFSAEAIQLLYQIATKGITELALAPTRKIGFEMTLLRMHAFLPATPKALPIHPTQSNTAPAPALHAVETNASAPRPLDWDQIIQHLPVSGLARAAIEQSELVAQTTDEFIIQVAHGHYSLFTPSIIKKLEQYLSDYTQHAVRLNIQKKQTTQTTPAQNRQMQADTQQQAAHHALLTDPFFQTLQTTFSAELIKNSVEPQ